MKIATSAIMVLVMALAFTACKDVEFQKTKGGVAYKIFPGKKSKDSISSGNIIKYNVVRTLIRKDKPDSILQNSHETMPAYEDVRTSDGSYLDAWPEILSKAHVGDSIYFEQWVDSFIVKQPNLEQMTPFRKGDKVSNAIRIMQVFKTPEEAQKDYDLTRRANADRLEQKQLRDFNNAQEIKGQLAVDNKLIEDHLKANNITNYKKSPWGAYVQVINEGTGDKPKIGQFVEVKYRGTTLEGEEFDAGIFPLQFGAGRSIKGFEEGVRFLGKGGKGVVYIPSVLAYGPTGSGERIKPNQVLKFELEVLNIGDEQPSQPADPNADPHEGHNH